MKPLCCFFWSVALSPFLMPGAAWGDIYVTNFTTLDSNAKATGVWRNVTTGVDLTIPVSLTQTGGMVLQLDAANPSKIDDGFPWQDIPAIPFVLPGGLDVFNPNFDGDAINVEVKGGATAVVTIQFNAEVVDPVISFTDVDTQTVMTVSSPFTVVGSSGNMTATATTVTPNGASVFLFDEECAGSLRVDGTHTEVVITLQNAGPDPDRDDDRTAFVVSTQVAPGPAAPPPAAELSIRFEGGNIVLSWPENADLSEIRWSTDLKDWLVIPDLDPKTASQWQIPAAALEGLRFFQGFSDQR